LVPGTSPKAFKVVSRSREELEDFFHAKSAPRNFSNERPGLLEISVWWFRRTDLAERFGGSPEPEALIAGFVEDLGLTTVELQALFGPYIAAEDVIAQ
jgi:hypothetical protein